MSRAERSGNRLDENDAAIVKGMLLRGDRQHDIAAWFGVNGGRIGEISKGHTYFYVTPQTTNLPPPGPYMSGEASASLLNEFKILRSRTRAILAQPKMSPEVKNLVLRVHDHIERAMNKYGAL